MTDFEQKRVVVTGVGAITPIGNTPVEYWEGLLSGRNGIGPITLFDASSLRSANLLNIERLLLIAERYIVSVEELHFPSRSILPHGASFQGQPLNLNVHCESHKTEFMIQVS